MKCEYCEGNEYIFDNGSLGLAVTKGSKYLVVNTNDGDYYTDVIINYCPICGKKLEED